MSTDYSAVKIRRIDDMTPKEKAQVQRLIDTAHKKAQADREYKRVMGGYNTAPSGLNTTVEIQESEEVCVEG